MNLGIRGGFQGVINEGPYTVASVSGDCEGIHRVGAFIYDALESTTIFSPTD